MTEDLEFLAYCDGWYEDDPIRRSAMEGRLRADPEAAARARDYKSQNETLRAAYDRRLREPVPDRISAALERAPRNVSRYWMRAAALCLLIATTTMVGWLIGRNGDGDNWSAENFASRSSLYFSKASSEKKSFQKPVDATPIDWSSRGIVLTLHPPNLREQGYSVVQKETVESGNDRMVKVVYAAPDGRTFDLFLQPRWTNLRERIRIEKKHGASVAYWSDGPLAAAVVSELPSDEMRAIAALVQQAQRGPKSSKPDVAPPPVISSAGSGEFATGMRPVGERLPPEPVAPPPPPLVPTNRAPG